MKTSIGLARLLKLWSLPGSVRNRLLNSVASLASGARVSVDWRDLKIIHPGSITIGSNFSAGRSLWLESVEGKGKLLIGNDVNISDFVHIGCLNRVEISDGVLIGSKVLITDHAHGRTGSDGISMVDVLPNRRALHSKGTVLIGRRVWIGDGACIMPGVTIGDGAVIGANAIVVRDVPPATVWAGVPAAQVWPRLDAEH